MANSTFKPYVRPGGAALAQAEHRGTMPRWYPARGFFWEQVIDVAASPGNIGATALTATAAQEIDLHVAFPNNLFPANVLIDGAFFYLQTDFSGGAISELTVQLGDTGDPNGLITATSVFTGASNTWFETVGAAQHAKRLETAFIPALTLTATSANVNVLTAGKLQLFIRFIPLPAQDGA